MGYIIKPIVTEKMSKLTDKSSLDKTRTKKGEKYTIPAQPKYGFIVKPEADKAWQDLAKTYTLASHNYMLKSAGDGMAMFQGCTLLQDSVMIDNQVLINYIVDVLGGVVGEDYADPYGQGRITVIEKK